MLYLKHRRSTTSQNTRKDPNRDIRHKPSKNIANSYAWGRNKRNQNPILDKINFRMFCLLSVDMKLKYKKYIIKKSIILFCLNRVGVISH